MPDLSGATEWLNGQPTSASLARHPVLVYFWSVSCNICHQSVPRLAEWRARYAARGLRLVAVHVPRQEQDTDLDGVRAALAAFQILDPCAVDNRHTLKAAFAAAYLPAYFLFDREGRLRARAGGEIGLGLLEQPLHRLFEREGLAPEGSHALATEYLTARLQ
jgi:thiol-disulfide isomerase/thioredoxin